MLSNIMNPAFSMPGGWEWMFVVGLALLLFGGKKIPQLAKDLGSGIREFKNAITGKNDDKSIDDDNDDVSNKRNS